MDLQVFLDHVGRRRPIEVGTDIQRFMSECCEETMRITAELNASYHTPGEIRELFSRMTGRPVDETFRIFPPFTADFGKNIAVGKNVFINSGCRFQDQGGIVLGDGVFIGHNVVLATLNHDLDPEKRSTLHPAPLRIGRNAWIGANATILPGVTVGEGSVIAAGAVVTGDVPPNIVAGGIPAVPIKEIGS